MSRKERKRRKALEKLLHRPLVSAEELQELEARVAASRREFVGHATSWAAVSGFLAVVNAMTSDHIFFLYVLLGWGMGIAAHAAHTFVTLPRGLAAQRQLLARRGLLPLEPEPPALETGARRASIQEELRLMGMRLREQLRDLPTPRVDLEAALEVAERQAVRIHDALAGLERWMSSPGAASAAADRRQALLAERERMVASLESFRVTLANLEVDALLLSNQMGTQGHALDALRTESDLLHAAAEGAQKAMEILGSGRTRSAERA